MPNTLQEVFASCEQFAKNPNVDGQVWENITPKSFKFPTKYKMTLNTVYEVYFIFVSQIDNYSWQAFFFYKGKGEEPIILNSLLAKDAAKELIQILKQKSLL